MAKLIGTNPDQVPTNADLGDMAYKDGENLQAGPLTINDGKVGVGASSLSDATLEIRPSSDIPQIKLTQSNVGDGGDGWKFHNSGPTGGNLAIIREASGTDYTRMTITTSGAVTATSFTGDGSGLTGLGGGTPSGAVIYHAANSPPTGFLKANGAAISRSTYAALFAVIGTTYGAGDGSSTFLVPDLRGEFPRGWDDSRGIDSGRSFGSAQADELKAHTHTANIYLYDSGGTHSKFRSSRAISYQGTTPTNSTGGSETRPRNLALLACIKY